MERLQFNFDYKAPYITEVNIEWEKIKVSFEINTEIKNNEEFRNSDLL